MKTRVHLGGGGADGQFRVLEGIAPGRIDLGVGRAPGSDRLTSNALNPYSNAADEFPQQVVDLHAWVSGVPLEAGHAFRDIKAHPQGQTVPEMWILGSSDYGAQLAAHFGLPYAYAYFFTDGRGVEAALKLYRHLYRPSERYPTPQATICIWALAAESEARARRLLMTREAWRVGFEKGLREPMISPEEAETIDYGAAEKAIVESVRAKAIVGTATEVGARIRQIAADLALDEIVVNTWTHDPAARIRSYELLAHEFGLQAA